MPKAVTAAGVDGAKTSIRIVGLHEGARSVVDGLARQGGVVRVHHAMDETYVLPGYDRSNLGVEGAGKQLLVARARVMPGDREIRQLL